MVVPYEIGELGPEKAGESGHAGVAGAGFGIGIVVGVGIDIICIESVDYIGDELDTGDLDAILSKECLVAVLQTGIDVVNDRKLRARLISGRAERVADRAIIGRAQFKPLACVDLDGIHELAPDELGASDHRGRRLYILLQQMQAIDRRVIILAGQIIRESVSSME